MVYRFAVPDDAPPHDAIRIRKRRGEVVTNASQADLPPEARSFVDPFHKPGDLYAHRLLATRDGQECLVWESKFVKPSFRPNRTICLRDLFHPADIEKCPVPNNVWAAVIHQNLDPDSWWTSTRSWLVKVRDGSFTLSDDLFWPTGQDPFDYSAICESDLYVMPRKMYEFLSYLSIQVEKAYYNYPKELPKGYSMHELIEFLGVAVGRYNSVQPVTRLGFAFDDGRAMNSRTVVPDEAKYIVIKLASIEAMKAMALQWVELDVAYSDGGADVDLSKHDKFQSQIDALEGNVMDELEREKQRWRAPGFFLGTTKTFAHPWTGANVGAWYLPVLHFRIGLNL